MRRLLAVCLVVAWGSASAASAGERRVTITAAPTDALVDVPVAVRVTNLTPSRAVTLEAATRDARGKLWRSRVVYRASAAGIVDTRSSMRLFWSMQPTAPGSNAALGMLPSSVSKVTVSVRSGGRTLARTTVTRRMSTGDVRANELSVSTDGIAATFYSRPETGPRPAVLQLGGSGGGHRSPSGALLASHDIPTLSLGYFGEPGLPANLADIPLEYFDRALRWLGSQPGVDAEHITLVGVSRGGEAALLTAANYPALVHGVLACTTDAHVLGALPPATGAAWTIDGNPILTGLLPVDRIAGPTLITGGGKDEISDSAVATRELEQFARANGRTNVVGTIYPHAGHGAGCRIPNIPAPTEAEIRPGSFEELGGTAAANSQAATLGWPALLRLVNSP